MKIIDAQVDWREGFDIDPRLEVLVDEIPKRSELRFEHEDGLWVAIEDGFVEYFEWSGDNEEGQYNSPCFEITTVGGENLKIKDPDNSRAGRVNNRGFEPIVDVSITTDPEVLKRGFTFQSGALTLTKARKATDLTQDAIKLKRIKKFNNSEYYWIPGKI